MLFLIFYCIFFLTLFEYNRLKIFLVMSTIRHQYDASRIKRWDKRSEEKPRPYLISQAWDTVRLYLTFSSFFLILSLICDISSSSDYSLLEVSREREREKLGLKIDIFPDTLKKISKNHFVSNLDYTWFIENRERISKTLSQQHSSLSVAGSFDNREPFMSDENFSSKMKLSIYFHVLPRDMHTYNKQDSNVAF